MAVAGGDGGAALREAQDGVIEALRITSHGAPLHTLDAVAIDTLAQEPDPGSSGSDPESTRTLPSSEEAVPIPTLDSVVAKGGLASSDAVVLSHNTGQPDATAALDMTLAQSATVARSGTVTSLEDLETTLAEESDPTAQPETAAQPDTVTVSAETMFTSETRPSTESAANSDTVACCDVLGSAATVASSDDTAMETRVHGSGVNLDAATCPDTSAARRQPLSNSALEGSDYLGVAAGRVGCLERVAMDADSLADQTALAHPDNPVRPGTATLRDTTDEESMLVDGAGSGLERVERDDKERRAATVASSEAIALPDITTAQEPLMNTVLSDTVLRVERSTSEHVTHEAHEHILSAAGMDELQGAPRVGSSGLEAPATHCVDGHLEEQQEHDVQRLPVRRSEELDPTAANQPNAPLGQEVEDAALSLSLSLSLHESGGEDSLTSSLSLPPPAGRRITRQTLSVASGSISDGGDGGEDDLSVGKTHERVSSGGVACKAALQPEEEEESCSSVGIPSRGAVRTEEAEAEGWSASPWESTAQPSTLPSLPPRTEPPPETLPPACSTPPLPAGACPDEHVTAAAWPAATPVGVAALIPGSVSDPAAADANTSFTPLADDDFEFPPFSEFSAFAEASSAPASPPASDTTAALPATTAPGAEKGENDNVVMRVRALLPQPEGADCGTPLTTLSASLLAPLWPLERSGQRRHRAATPVATRHLVERGTNSREKEMQ